MMTATDFSEVRSRLEEAVKQTLPASVTDPLEIYDHHEMLCVQILDGQHAEYQPGILQGFLEMYLAELRIKLGLQ